MISTLDACTRRIYENRENCQIREDCENLKSTNMPWKHL